MASLALDSVENTIENLLYSSRISIEYPSEKVLKYALNRLESVGDYIRRFNKDKNIKSLERERKALDDHIREAARKLEDAIDWHVLDQILSQSEESRLAEDEQHRLSFSVDLQELRQDVDCFAETLTKMDILFADLPDDAQSFMPYAEDDDYRVIRDWLIDDYATRAASFFGMKDEYVKELRKLLPKKYDDYLGSYLDEDDDPYQNIHRILVNWCVTKAASLFGMEEEEYINKLENPSMTEEKDDDAAASSTTAFGGNQIEMVGLSDLFCEIRDRLLGGSRWQVLTIIGMAGSGKTTLVKKIFEDPLILKNYDCRVFVRVGQKLQFKEIKKAIITEVIPDFDVERIDELGYSLPWTAPIGRKYLIVFDDVWDLDFWHDFKTMFPNGDYGSVLMTTRRAQLLKSLKKPYTYDMPFLNKEESWDLFRGTAFAEEGCPPKLEKAGKKIVENCEGLPLFIVTVAGLLSKAERTPEYWNKVATDKQHSIFMDAFVQISEVLYPSYNYLPPESKTFFLYMAVFPQNYEVSLSKLINLWWAEGSFRKHVERTIMGGYEDLVLSNLVLVRRRSNCSRRLKACALHSVFWHLCKREASKDKFIHIFNSHSDAFAEGVKIMRCLSIYKNILFGIKDVYDSMASISNAHQLLCTGPLHQYQVPMCFGLSLLRVLDALTIRFYEFPMEVLKLIYLRYLALTCNDNLPPSISKLWNLRCLIVHQYLSIKSSIVESYLPVEIWYLQELNYLDIMGRNLPDPPDGVALERLITLLDVGACSCTKSVLQSLPRLDKLRVQIALAPDATEPLSCFDHILVLDELKSLHYVVVNPNLKSEIVAPPSPLSVFELHLRKLTLSGFGYPWKDMNKIANLPFLKVLKLQCYAFRGEKWEAKEYMFPRLEYLLIEDTDLVQWTTGYKNFTVLLWLTIKNCYKLQQIPKIPSVQEIQMVDCNPLAVTCAKQMEHDDCRVYVDSSFFV